MARAFFILVIVVIFTFSFQLSFAGQAEDEAIRMFNTSLDKFGSKDGVKQNIVNPMLSGNTPMRTIDGSESFNAQISCPSSKEFLHVFIQPSSTGDLSTVIVRQDTNFDGSYDYSFGVPVLVSGVCANGIISCTAGKWTGCKFYKWMANGSRVGLLESSLEKLGGCFCINNSCGYNLVLRNLPIVLKTLGGGIVGAIQAVNPKSAVSDVKIQDTSIYYYGQIEGNCSYSTTPAGSGTGSPEYYYSNPFRIDADAKSLSVSQSTDSTSYYSLLSNNLYMRNVWSDVVTCQINRVINCQTESGSTSAVDYVGFYDTVINRCSEIEKRSECELRDETVDGVLTFANFSSTGLSPEPVCKTVIMQKEATCTVSATLCSAWTYTCPLDASIPCDLGKCVQIKEHKVCNWWEKKRTYLCSGQTVDFSDARRRMESLKSTTTDNVTSLYYTDVRKDEKGNWVTESSTVGLSPRYEYTDCELACKVRRPVTDTQASLGGHTAQYRVTTQAYDYFYKNCWYGTCPVGAGEEIDIDCRCINEFAEAAVTMQSLRMAGADLICSSQMR